MKTRTTTSVRFRSPGNARIRPAETVRCPNGDEFGIDRSRFYASQPARADRVTCPFCGQKTPLPAAH